MFFNWGAGLLDAFRNIYYYFTGPIPGFEKIFNNAVIGPIVEWFINNDRLVEELKTLSFADLLFSRVGIVIFTSVLLFSWAKRVFSFL